MRNSFAVAIAVAASSFAASAQEVTRLPASAQQSVSFDAGLESAFVARATYLHRADVFGLADSGIYTRVTFPFFAPDVRDWGIEGGVRATVASFHDFRLALLAGPVIRNTSNDLYAATAAGLGATALLGYQGERWG